MWEMVTFAELVALWSIPLPMAYVILKYLCSVRKQDRFRRKALLYATLVPANFSCNRHLVFAACCYCFLGCFVKCLSKAVRRFRPVLFALSFRSSVTK
jgi:hypothetical protein